MLTFLRDDPAVNAPQKNEDAVYIQHEPLYRAAPALAAEVERLKDALQKYVLAVAVGGSDTKESIMGAIREADNNARAVLAALARQEATK